MPACATPPKSSTPLTLSLDITLQSAVEEVLGAGMRMMNAKGAAAILMEVHTGEILAIASLPDFDPNDRPQPALTGDPSRQPAFQPRGAGGLRTGLDLQDLCRGAGDGHSAW